MRESLLLLDCRRREMNDEVGACSRNCQCGHCDQASIVVGHEGHEDVYVAFWGGSTLVIPFAWRVIICESHSLLCFLLLCEVAL